jgi:hypothetical protein
MLVAIDALIPLVRSLELRIDESSTEKMNRDSLTRHRSTHAM